MQQAALRPPASFSFFGDSVAISGDTAVVGESEDNQAFVFVRTGSRWSLQATLKPPDQVLGGFGYSVAIAGGTVVVGDPYYGATGEAWVFVGSIGGVWSPRARLVPSDGSLFGTSVAIWGTTIVVRAAAGLGAPAFIFVPAGTTWTQEAELLGAECGGGGVAISGSTVVLGDPFAGLQGEGAACVFTESGGVWAQQAVLTASDPGADDQFGDSVAVYRSTIVVSAHNHDSRTGAAYIFQRSGDTWVQEQEFTGSDSQANSHFGWRLAMSGRTVIVGANPIGLPTTGAAYVFVPA
jgi:hypothetical protein